MIIFILTNSSLVNIYIFVNICLVQLEIYVWFGVVCLVTLPSSGTFWIDVHFKFVFL